ncbi:hypothetical protein E4H12_04515 [Candidatus Thorarchaeota archaeon]|nr:hypothetical protein [Candidatus Thorarchaeota archaeon]TFG98922.1 MAG: hypothetical protein E4H12_04515 [Candidatus Thorarchaeota archaeon]
MSTPRRHIVEPGEDVAEKFQEHLNGPRGKAVLDNLEDGEIITIENKEHILKIKKEKGKGFVDFVGYVHDKGKF